MRCDRIGAEFVNKKVGDPVNRDKPELREISVKSKKEKLLKINQKMDELSWCMGLTLGKQLQAMGVERNKFRGIQGWSEGRFDGGELKNASGRGKKLINDYLQDL